MNEPIQILFAAGAADCGLGSNFNING